MTCKLLLFDYRKAEEQFFNENNFDNYDIKFFKESLNKETVKTLPQEDLDEAAIISVFIGSEIDKEVISKFKNLRVISTRSTGYNHICINSCAERNIALVNVDSYGHASVAQFTIGLMIMLVRNILPALNIKIDNTFVDANLTGHNLNNLTLGVIGTGAIGSAVAKYAKCFGMNILAFDLKQNRDLVENNFVRYVEMDELLKLSDIVTLHSVYTRDNYKMISENQFNLMKNNSYFINVSRGELVDNEALLNSLDSGKLKGAGLDVVSCVDLNDFTENKTEKSSILCVETSETLKRLKAHPNVIITPHIAYDTQEAIDFILQTTFDGITDFLSGGFKYRVL